MNEESNLKRGFVRGFGGCFGGCLGIVAAILVMLFLLSFCATHFERRIEPQGPPLRSAASESGGGLSTV